LKCWLRTQQPTRPQQKRAKRKAKAKANANSDSLAASSRPLPKEEKVEEYKVTHLGVYTENNIPWPPEYDEHFENKTQSLAQRAKQLLWLDEKLHPLHDLKQWVVRDLNMTMEWSRAQSSKVACIVSSSTLWLRGPVVHPNGTVVVHDRLLCGAELLSLQGVGLEFQSRSRSAQLSHAQKTDLAGNAFSGNVVIAVLIASFLHVPLDTAFGMLASSSVDSNDTCIVRESSECCDGEEYGESEEGTVSMSEEGSEPGDDSDGLGSWDLG